MVVLLLKLFLAPALVVGSTLAGRRWGPGVTGVLVGMPIVAGPILFITYLQNGAAFGAGAARSTLLGLVSLAVFAVVFARTARRFSWFPTLLATWIVVLAVDALLSLTRIPLPVAVAGTLAATVAGLVLVPRTAPDRRPATAVPPRSTGRRGTDRAASTDGPAGEGTPVPPSWDLPGRAVATGVLVLAVTTASSVLGPRWTGILAPFPIATSVVAAFVLAQRGPAVTARTLDGMLMGLFAFAVFCLVLIALVGPLGAAAFAPAVPVTVAVQLLAGRIRTALRTRRA